MVDLVVIEVVVDVVVFIGFVVRDAQRNMDAIIVVLVDVLF